MREMARSGTFDDGIRKQCLRYGAYGWIKVTYNTSVEEEILSSGGTLQ